MGSWNAAPSRREVVAGAAAALVVIPAALAASPPADLLLQDASGLEATRVARHARIATGETDRLVADIRRLLKEAADEGRPFVTGGARHSMGGQSLVRDGSAATLSGAACRPDPAARSYRVSAGSRWRDVLAALDPIGWSVPVMQSNNDFSVGGSLSVNAHGWAVPFGPLGASLRAFRIVLADGSLVECRPGDELFRLAVGGYGLFGVIVEADLAMTENLWLEPRQEVLPAARFGARFADLAATSGARMAYGRLNVARDGFLQEAVLVSFHPAVGGGPLASADARSLAAYLSGTVLRAQRGSEAGKRARWYAETVLAKRIAPRRITRNRLLSQSAATLVGPGRRRTDMLHEYFLPPSGLEPFLGACRKLIPRSGQDLLNITLRYVDSDAVSALSFAPAPRIAAVMLFSQARTGEAETAMRGLTVGLVEAALSAGGSYYLPYRLHATPEQLRRAYPAFDGVLERKRVYDPGLRFRNVMFDRYFAA